MINKDNFRELLKLLGFSELKGQGKGILAKHFDDFDMRADFNNETLIYPEEKGFKVNERQTCNFQKPENFVVFECVHRLLSKGYKPAHIELEPKWKLGHGASGGRADILIKDNGNNALLIIECKTWGDEFDGEWKSMLLNGGQLFSYAQQIKSTQFLCLYASDFRNGQNVYSNYIISLNDNKVYLKSLKAPLAFIDATDVLTLYKAWYYTYNHEYETKGIFEDEVAAYKIGKTKRTTHDLQEVSHDDIKGKYHEFATILRQHNVSGRENAFDKLVNLFLAKIVDEMQNPDELLFHWKGVAFDDYYSLQDRIQRLYRDGMQKFLGEEVTYIDNGKINDAFRLFKSDPDATRETILDYFRQLKFYTNNDFAFLDVHNEHLFFQNSAILLKIVRMLQDIKLRTEEQNQFLGDLFEGFLDQGVKQSEGQFFTPMPIVKFLVSSLPLEQLAKSSSEPLAVIDYACGAGHFLNEYATQIRKFVPAGQLHEYYGSIVGIEKEYRLSKVAKVSAFMYGQEEIQIVYADALAAAKDNDGIYNVLISNPPYSVRGFLETLTEEERATFEITKVIDSKALLTNNSIEAFFVERAKQLLSPGGVAAIILPSSLLSNSGSIYSKVREIILQYFDIIGIAEFNSGTFGKTGTNTVTLFMRRKADNPDLAEHYRNRVNAWFRGDFTKDEVFEDAHLLTAYCNHMNFDLADFKSLLLSSPNEALLNVNAFKTYRAAFYEKPPKLPKKMNLEEQSAELSKRFITYVREIEKDKLYFFMLAYSNPQPVAVVKSPSGTSEIKKFLGYEWSSRKGAEGIKYIGTAAEDEDDVLSRIRGIKSIQTPLINPNDLDDVNKINTVIRKNYMGIQSQGSEYVHFINLIDMLDFTGTKFEKAVSLMASHPVEVVSKYPLTPLDAVCFFDRIQSDTSDDNLPYVGMEDVDSTGRISDKVISRQVKVESSTFKFDNKHILYGRLRPYLKKTAIPSFSGRCSTELIPIACKNNIEKNYLYQILRDKSVIDYVMSAPVGMRMPRANLDRLMQYRIPLPTREIQREIIAACKSLEEEYEHTNKSIDENRDMVEQLLSSMESGTNEDFNLGNESMFSLSIGKRVLDSQLISEGEVPVYSANVYEPFGLINEKLITDFSIPSVLWGIDGDWQVNYVAANSEFYPTDHCGVLRVLSEKVHPRCLAWALEKAGKERGFTRTLRASIDRVKRLVVSLPTIEQQNEVANKVLALEAQIEAEKAQLFELDKKRQSVLDSYLK